MKQTPIQEPLTLNADFSKLRVSGEAANVHIHIELAIFDLMSDGKARTVNEVVGLLTPLGYNRRDINSRMVAMLYKKGTFVGAGRGPQSAAAYTIKKNAKRPVPRLAIVANADVRPSDIKVPSMQDTPFKTNPKSSLVVAPQPLVPTVSYKPPAKQLELPAPTATPVEVATEELHVALTAEPAKKYVVEPTDSIRAAIWKVMQDGALYTLQELHLLLDHITESALGATVRAMANEVLFDISRESGSRTPLQYRLRPNVPMPQGFPPYQPRLEARKSEAAKVLETDPLYVDVMKFATTRATFTIADVAAALPNLQPRTVESRVRKLASEGIFNVSPPAVGSKANVYRLAERQIEATDDVQEPIQQIETIPAPAQSTFTPHWEARLDALEETGKEIQMEEQQRQEQDQRDAAAKREEEEAEREANAERNRLLREAEQARMEKEAKERAIAQEAAKAAVKSFTDPAPVVQAKPGVYEVAETPLVSVGGIFIKGRRFGFRDAMVIMEELDAIGMTGEDVHEDLQNEARKFVKLELRVTVAGMDLTVAEAKVIAIQLKKDLN